MGMIYRRKKRDPTRGHLKECASYWMKYYIGLNRRKDLWSRECN